MKRREVVFTKQALRDLDKLHDGIVERTGSRIMAERYQDRLLAVCARIGDSDEGGRPRDDIRPRMRSWVFERRMIVLYRVETRQVCIVRIVDGRRDYPRLFASLKVS